MKYELLFSSRFKKSFSKLQDQEKRMFYKKLTIYVENHTHPTLRTKKIRGSQILFESSINMSIRVIWIYKNDNLILMLDIVHHDILKRM